MTRLVKITLVLALIGGLGYGGYLLLFAKNREAACTQVLRLCGGSGPTMSRARCGSFFSKVKQLTGQGAQADQLDCIKRARNCKEALLCTAGELGEGAWRKLKGALRSLF